MDKVHIYEGGGARASEYLGVIRPAPAELALAQQKGPAKLPLVEAYNRTQYPYVTGTSVLGIKYKDGVMIAADMLGAYGCGTTRF